MVHEPFVSIVTPVYNGEPFIGEAIESVLQQGYSNFEYIIVNNQSTDRTHAIAHHYAALDRRIRVVTTEVFANCEENHNNAFRAISPHSEYCKVVSADDRLVHGALRKLLAVATLSPTIGLVGSYQQRGPDILWKGLPEACTVISGREVCRLGLLQGVHVLGNPMSVLYRADLVRRSHSFFPHDRPHADSSAAYSVLRESDFGFVHEVLSEERIHESQVSVQARQLDAGVSAAMEILLRYGPFYLTDAELSRRTAEMLADYYLTMARALLRGRSETYWSFHRDFLSSVGLEFSWLRIGASVMRLLGSKAQRPVASVRQLLRGSAGG